MSKFKSQFFKTAEDLVQAKDDAWSVVKDRRDRLDQIRKFVNMWQTLSEEEKKELNRTEATNFGTFYRELQENEVLFKGMTSGTRNLVEIKVDTDNPEQDSTLSQRLGEALNRGAICRKGRMSRKWGAMAGEIVIAGGGPMVMPPKYGWEPELRPDMFFPRETALDSSRVPYAFDPVELSLKDLCEYKKAVASEDGGEVMDVDNLDALIKALKEQIGDRKNKSFGSSSTNARSRSVRDRQFTDTAASISAWWYYEVKFDEDGSTYVSSTLFTDGIEVETLASKGKDKGSSARIIAYWDKSYEMAGDWLEIVAIDAEIGGIKNIDTLRGVAELMYPSALEMEELFNLLLEGDKQRAKPKYRVAQGQEDAFQKWNSLLDSFVPEGIEEFEFKTNAQHLLTPIQYLRGTAVSMGGGSNPTTGKNRPLRVQELESQRSNLELKANRLVEAYDHLDSILETVVWRLLAGPVKPGTPGYEDTMWVRSRLKQYGIDFKKLAEREHGRFVWIQVSAKRVAGGGNREEQIAIADWLMANIINFPPQNRPKILKLATVLQTGDPDLAEDLASVPQSIINAQKVTAENERDTIRHRVALGQVLPVMPTDIHQDHIPVHMLDMQALLARDAIEPWRKIDMLEFAGLTEHTGEHLQILMSNPATNPEAKQYMRGFMNLVSAAAPIAKRVEEQKGNESQQLNPAEQAQLEVKLMQEQRKWVELGMKAEDMKGTQKQRLSREMLSHRGQYAGEVQAAQRLELDKVKTAADIQSQKQSDKPSEN